MLRQLLKNAHSHKCQNYKERFLFYTEMVILRNHYAGIVYFLLYHFGRAVCHISDLQRVYIIFHIYTIIMFIMFIYLHEIKHAYKLPARLDS